MNDPHYKPIRFRIYAKRKNTDEPEPWTDWSAVNEHEKAVAHAEHVEELGYLAKIVDKGVQAE